MDVKTTVSTFWKSNSSTIVKSIIAIVVIIVLVVVGWWYAGRAVNKLAADLRAQAILDNRPLYDNLAILKDRTQQLEYQYGFQKSELDKIRKAKKGGVTDAFNNPDKNVAAKFFDNVINSYVPVN